MSETPPTSPYITTRELGRLIGKGPAAVRTMRSRGNAPAGVRFGRPVLYHRDDVRAWLEAKRLTDPLLYYRPSVQEWLGPREDAHRSHRHSASAA